MADVLAVHKLTGIIAPVPEEYLDIYPELTKATDKQLKAVKDQAETELYGAPLKDGVIPVDVEPVASKPAEGDAKNG